MTNKYNDIKKKSSEIYGDIPLSGFCIYLFINNNSQLQFYFGFCSG